ncbi:2OG-Fe(II) oxygenase [Nocardia uniformis]|uniref:2OG-Fe(II) oxygenase n=1 Tax=Nocardia uniformis TaxID=53432 RepID=A0A849BV27_9NOCA|nr:2OG-Fe(II) oxygenase [Nocardia uniformis]NNH70432.1 2OG-Fe(II) oxygenase [Nocardia uniformis]
MSERNVESDDHHFVRHADLQDLASIFVTRRFVNLPGLIRPDDAAYLLESTEGNARRRVRCGLENVSWEEQELVAGDLSYEFCRHPELTRLIEALAGPVTIESLMCWASRYGAGEYINPHRDRYGTVQLLVCLKSVHSRHQGGALVVAGTELFLSAGDAVVFDATCLEHHTTPLVASAEQPTPLRVVLVGRYFA